MALGVPWKTKDNEIGTLACIGAAFVGGKPLFCFVLGFAGSLV
jgi:hypothetical protein